MAAGQEKITFNVNVVELAKIDYLIENGFYSNRSDFMRTALRNQLTQHDVIVSDEAVTAKMEQDQTPDIRTVGCIGVFILSKNLLKRNDKLNIFVVGSCFIDKDVTLELFKEVVVSAKIYGILKGPKDVVSYIKKLKNN